MKSRLLLMASLAMLGASKLKAQLNVGATTAPAAVLYVNGPIAQPQVLVTPSSSDGCNVNVGATDLAGAGFVTVQPPPDPVDRGDFPFNLYGAKVAGQHITINNVSGYTGTVSGISIPTGATYSLIYDGTNSQWLQVSASSTPQTIYTADGTLATDRVITQAGHSLYLKEGHVKIDSSLYVDASGTFNGIMGSSNGAMLRFGLDNNSGEGIGSVRTGTNNYLGLDLYSNSTSRMSITNAGEITIPGNVSVGSSTMPTSTFAVTGSTAVPTAVKTAAYTATITDNTILCNTTAAGFTLSLPDASTCTGRLYSIRKTDQTANVLTFSTSIKVSETTTVTTTNINGTLRIQSDGTTWNLIN